MAEHAGYAVSQLSSLLAHLVKFRLVEMNPVRDLERPAVSRRDRITLAFSQAQARTILDALMGNPVLGV
jgi:hypothetical protein